MFIEPAAALIEHPSTPVPEIFLHQGMYLSGAWLAGPGPLSLHQIRNAVCAYYGVSVAEVYVGSPHRTDHSSAPCPVLPRQAADGVLAAADRPVPGRPGSHDRASRREQDRLPQAHRRAARRRYRRHPQDPGGSMSKPTWMPFYYHDFRQDTVDLTPEEKWVYLELICLAWHRGDGSIPDNMDWLKTYLQTQIIISTA